MEVGKDEAARKMIGIVEEGRVPHNPDRHKERNAAYRKRGVPG